MCEKVLLLVLELGDGLISFVQEFKERFLVFALGKSVCPCVQLDVQHRQRLFECGDAVLDLDDVLMHTLQVSLGLSAIQPDDGAESLDVIFAKVTDGSIHSSVYVPCIEHQYGLFLSFISSFVEKPQSAGEGSGVEKIRTYRHYDVDVACFYDLLSDVFFGVRGIGC